LLPGELRQGLEVRGVRACLARWVCLDVESNLRRLEQEAVAIDRVEVVDAGGLGGPSRTP